MGQAMDEKQRIMKTGIFPTENEASIFLIAQIIGKTGAPVGAWSLKEELKKVGIYCGTATVGRYLKELDYKGLTAQKSNKGRVLTDYGQQWLNKLSDDVARALVHTESTQAMRVDHYSQLVDLIQARKVLEVAAARLAAERATKEDLLLLQQVVMTHYRYVAENKDPTDPALEFHSLVAQISHNRFMKTMLDMLIFEERNIEGQIDTLITRERGDIYVVEHEDISNAIAAGDSAQAASLMDAHIDKLMTAVQEQIQLMPQDPSEKAATLPGSAD